MILGFALVLTLLQVGVSFAVPPNIINQADLNELERSVDVLQNYFHEMHTTDEREFASQQQHPTRRRPDTANAPEVHTANEREFASQQHQPRCRHPDTTDTQLGNTPLPVHIQDYNSGLFLQYTPNNDYQVVIERYNSANIYQQWYVIQSNYFPDYYVIANSTATDPSTRVITANNDATSPLYLEVMSTGINLSQLWSFRQPSLTSVKNYVIANANAGLVMNVHNSYTAPGTEIRVYFRNNDRNQQFFFRG